jgi:hypothetical protein
MKKFENSLGLNLYSLNSEAKTYYPIGDNISINLEFIENLKNFLKDNFNESHDIKLYCQGSSGAIISGIIAAGLVNYKVTICHVKKPGENSHWGNVDAYSRKDNTLFIFVDDFIESGQTLIRVFNNSYIDKFDIILTNSRIGKFEELSDSNAINIIKMATYVTTNSQQP